MSVKKTGPARQFDTGAQRDSAEGKPRMSLVPHKALYDVMQRYLAGAEAYGENNWKLGMKNSVLYDGAVLWNVMGLIDNQDKRPEMDDRKEFE